MFNDAFLRIFGCQDSKAVTLSFVNSILRAANMPELERIDSISSDAAVAGGVSLRTSRSDVIILSDDRVIDMEAQRRHADVGNKSLFYAAKLLCEHTPRGSINDYSDMPQVIVITLLEGARLHAGEQLVSVSHIEWSDPDGARTGVRMTDRMACIVIELDKLKARYNEVSEEVLSDELLSWLYVLAKGYLDEGEVSKLMGSFPTIEEFSKLYGIAIDDPDIKRSYDLAFEAHLEEGQMKREAREAGFKEGFEDGFEDGRAKGFEDGRAKGFEDGRAKGFEDGRKAAIDELVSRGLISTEIADELITYPAGDRSPLG